MKEGVLVLNVMQFGENVRVASELGPLRGSLSLKLRSLGSSQEPE